MTDDARSLEERGGATASAIDVLVNTCRLLGAEVERLREEVEQLRILREEDADDLRQVRRQALEEAARICDEAEAAYVRHSRSSEADGAQLCSIKVRRLAAEGGRDAD